MTFLGIIALAIAIAALCFQFYEWGYKRGHNAADLWWIDAEHETYQAREEIWREKR